jgi:hypothetical protein
MKNALAGWLTKRRWRARAGRRDAELRAEIEFHLDEEADERRAMGLSDDDARLAARRDLGNRALVEEDTRAAWGWTATERLMQDLRYAARVMRRTPAFSATAIVTLMLAMGGTTAMFSLLDAPIR